MKVRRLEVGELPVFKVVGPQATLSEYHSHCQQTAGRRAGGDPDWAGALYLQLTKEHALGTLPYRWEQGFQSANLLAATIAAVRIVEVDDTEDDFMIDGTVSGARKALVVKEALELEPTGPLMLQLGEQGLCLKVRETEDEWELVVPDVVLPGLELRAQAVAATYQQHPTRPFESVLCTPDITDQ